MQPTQFQFDQAARLNHVLSDRGEKSLVLIAVNRQLLGASLNFRRGDRHIAFVPSARSEELSDSLMYFRVRSNLVQNPKFANHGALALYPLYEVAHGQELVNATFHVGKQRIRLKN